MGNITTVDQNNIESFLKENPIALIGFWAAWCGPCKMMSPILYDLATQHSGKYVVGKVNVDECKELSEQYAIENLPTLLVIKHGKEVGRIIGYLGVEELKKEIVGFLF